MKIGMYNRWLATLGGGEKHSLAIAEYLSRNHEVKVISHRIVSKEEAARRLNIDLSRVTFDFIPEQNDVELSQLTREFDLFMNVSFMDFIQSKAPKSIALIYFPVQISDNLSIKYKIGWWIKKQFLLPSLGPEYCGVRWLDHQNYQILGNNGISFNLLSAEKGYSIEFILQVNASTEDLLEVYLDGRLVNRLDFKQSVTREVSLEIPPSPSRHEIWVRPNSIGSNVQVAVSNISIDHPRFRFFKFMMQLITNKIGIRFILLPFRQSKIVESINTYDMIWANSEYTRRWIRNYWKKPSFVLYPPVDIGHFTPLPKKPIILNVGRFFEGSHNKKHLVMVSAFKKMVDGGLTGWELHLAGGTTPGEIHERYIQKIRDESRGYPIILHPDLEHTKLVQLYGESSIYWHASGYNEDDQRDPIRFEHFGITTVEAMASGCVPVVIGRGGQPEIVTHGVNGYLWNSTDQLIRYTHKLISDPHLLATFSEKSLLQSRTYSGERFCLRLNELISELEK